MATNIDAIHQSKRNIPISEVNRRLEKSSKIIISTLVDLKAVIKKCLTIQQIKTSQMKVSIPWVDLETKERGIDNTSGESSDINLYQMLIEGLDKVKAHDEALQKGTDKIKLSNLEKEIPNLWQDTKFNVDYLIERRLGGKRAGLRIRWEVKEGTFEFDPYIKKLFEIK